MLVGSYWKHRPETPEQAAGRVLAFLERVQHVSPAHRNWFRTGWSRSKALKNPVSLELQAIGSSFERYFTDVGRRVIPELGFRLDLWNGLNSSFGATIGAYGERAGNRAVLDVGDEDGSGSDDAQWRALLEAAVAAFEPEDGIVVINSTGDRWPGAKLRDVAWLKYEAGKGISEFPEFR